MKAPALAVAILPLWLAACGGTNLPAQAGANGPSGVPGAPNADLSQVPEPERLVLVGRVSNPAAMLKALNALTQLPAPGSEQVTELLTTEAVGSLVDLEQPIDFAAIAPRKGLRMVPLVAVSAGIKDIEKAKARFSEHYQLAPWENGAWIVEGMGRADIERDKYSQERAEDDAPGEEEWDEPQRSCVLAPAFGAAPWRLVCGWSRPALSALVPYLTRTATRGSSTSDVHVELRMAPVKPVLEREQTTLSAMIGAIAGARFNAGARNALTTLVKESVASALELDVVSFDSDIKEDVATASLGFKFNGATSLWARVFTGHPEKTDAPPSAFWQLPGDAAVATFYRGIEPKDFELLSGTAAEVIGGQLASDGVGESDRKAVVDALRKMMSSAPLVYASGVDDAALQKAIAQERSARRSSDPAERQEARRVLAESLMGWSIYGVQEPQKKLADAAKDLSNAWARPGIARAYRAKNKDGLPLTLKVTPLPKGSTLPKETVHLEASITQPSEPGEPAAKDPKGKKPSAPKPFKVHVYIVPDGDRTWVGVGSDETLVTTKVGGMLAGAPETNKLANRPGLERLKDARLGSGGFFTFAGLPAMAGPMELLTRGRASGVERYDDLARSPNRGTTPVTFTFTAQPGSPGPAVATLTLPKAAVQDLMMGLMRDL